MNLPDWPPPWPEIRSAVERCLESGQWGSYHSDVCQALEKRLTSDFQTAACRLCCSGTAALEIALRACRIGTGDEVIVAAFDYPGNFRTIELLGAKPVLVDAESDSAGMNVGQLAQTTGDQVRAVVASHLFGVAADIQAMRELCDDRGWVLIEDACQVAGMQIDNRPAGSFGHFATLSFGGSKLVSAGSGGALLVNSDRLAARLGSLLDRPGETFPLSPLQAAVIDPQLDRLAELNAQRNETVSFIESELNSRLPKWSWLSKQKPNHKPAAYKVAWTAESSEQRARIVSQATSLGLPIGEGFRSMSGCSDKRCRKPMPTPRADLLSETLFVLDHRALLIPESQRHELARLLIQLHDQV
ncbi:MAG: DegT/DnrJ/EryC1/StrS family aminotransferase [Rubripirellula sp.]